MKLPFEVLGLRTVLGRRMALLFLLSAVLPMTWVAIEAYRQLETQLDERIVDEVRSTTASTAAAVMQRLRLAEAELDLVNRLVDQQETELPGLSTLGAVYEVAPGRPPRALTGAAPGTVPEAGSAAETRSGALLVADTADGRAAVWLGRPVSSGEGRWLWATVEVDSLVATARINAEVVGSRGICLVGPVGRLVCDAPLTAAQMATVLAADGSTGALGDRQVAGDGGTPLRVGYRELFLRGRYGAEPWVALAVFDEARLRAAGADFRWIFPRILLVALAMVLLVSHDQIRRNLRPLEALSETSRRIGTGDLEARVEVDSRDEFGAVADTFNHMASQVALQLRSAQALGRLGRSVLADPRRESLVRAVIEEAATAVEADAVALWLCGEAEGAGEVYSAVAGDPASRHVEARSADHVGRPAPGSVVWREAPADWLRDLPPFAAEQFGRFIEIGVGGSGCDAVVVLASYEADAFPPSVRSAALQLGEQVAMAISTVELVERLERTNAGALGALSQSIDMVSPWTAGHAERVAALSVAMGRRLGLEGAELELLQRAALLHDIGMLSVPSGLLERPGALSPQEEDRLRDHVTLGSRVLEPLPALSEAVPVVAQHHERWDGAGYPAGLSGEGIHRLARVVAVADAFDDLTSRRPDQEALTGQAAMLEITRQAGSTYDPAMVEALRAVLRIELPEEATQEPVPA